MCLLCSLAKILNTKNRTIQEICLEYMFNNLTIQHIFNCLELAFQLNIEELKLKSIEFAVKNKHQIQDNDEWEPLIQRCPQISITFMKCLTKESDDLQQKVQELEARLEAHKCPHHHCRIPHHEILLRHQRHLQQVRETRRRDRNEQLNQPFRDRIDEIVNRVREERERQNLPPLEQLRPQERNRILHDALNRYQMMGFEDSDNEEFDEPEPAIHRIGDFPHPQQDWRQPPGINLQRIRAANENQQNGRYVPPIERARRANEYRQRNQPNENDGWRNQRNRRNENEDGPLEGQRFVPARLRQGYVPPRLRQGEAAPEPYQVPQQPALQVIELDESDNEGDNVQVIAEQPAPEPRENHEDAEMVEEPGPARLRPVRIIRGLMNTDDESETDSE